MNIGKVPGNVLKRSVVNLIGKGPRTGVDSAVLKQGDEFILSATQVGLVNSEIAPLLAVYKACNNIWAAGGEVQGVEAAFLLSEKTKERVLKELTRKTMHACRMCNTELSGGHTEVSDCINRAVSTVTAVGTSKNKPRDVRDIKPGMDIVMTKWAGLEEAAILIHNEEAYARLKERFSEYYLDGFGNYEDWLTVREEALVAAEFPNSSTIVDLVISSISEVLLVKFKNLQPYIIGGHAERMCTSFAPLSYKNSTVSRICVPRTIESSTNNNFLS